MQKREIKFTHNKYLRIGDCLLKYVQCIITMVMKRTDYIYSTA